VKLHTYFRSSCSYRVRIALHWKGLPFESEFVHLRRGEQHDDERLSLNPQGLVPTLEDGELVLSQSFAILEYLEEQYPDPPLLPLQPAARARVRQISQAIVCEIQPLQNIGTLRSLRRDFGLSEADTTRYCRELVQRGLAAVEALLVGSPATGLCCHGDTPSFADLCLIPQVYNARRFDCDLSTCPTIERIDEHCTALGAFRQAAPHAQPDAEGPDPRSH
jgi:maleylacetoacetate isomerase